MSEELTMAELFNTYTSPDLVKEATSRPTLRSGAYLLTAKKVTPRVGDERSPWPGRKSINVQYQAEKDGAVAGTLFVEADFDSTQAEKYRTKSGRQDKLTRLWGHLVDTLDAKEKSVGETIERILQYPVMGQVQEVFTTGTDSEGKNIYKQPKSEEERATFIKAGYEAFNSVTSIRKVK